MSCYHLPFSSDSIVFESFPLARFVCGALFAVYPVSVALSGRALFPQCGGSWSIICLYNLPGPSMSFVRCAFFYFAIGGEKIVSFATHLKLKQRNDGEKKKKNGLIRLLV